MTLEIQRQAQKCGGVKLYRFILCY